MRLFKTLFRRAPDPDTTCTVPAGERIYAIGDIHGRSDLLDAMVGLISSDLHRSPAPRARIVLLGDYIDRGPDSKGVLDRLSSDELPVPAVTLRGNHELMLLTFLMDPETASDWRRNGGLETLHSYGLDVRELRAGRGFGEAAESFQEVFPPAHLKFLRSTELFVTVGDYYFCHAGIRPGVPLNLQDENDLLWIREPFISSPANHGKRVVHGHTPTMEPDIRPNRINIDTGAYISGRLTCLVLESDQLRFLATGHRV